MTLAELKRELRDLACRAGSPAKNLDPEMAEAVDLVVETWRKVCALGPQERRECDCPNFRGLSLKVWPEFPVGEDNV